MKTFSRTLLLGLVLAATGAQAASRDYISVVGSSTVYPFATVVAERFGKSTGFKTPKIESTGTGGGMKIFCQGVGVVTPDVSNASRRIKQSELDLCKENGVDEVIEVLIGFDGIVMANSREATSFSLTLEEIFLALAAEVPGPTEGELIDNPYKTWDQINLSLPTTRIEVLGPPPTSGTRDAFVELAMEGGCNQIGWIMQMTVDAKQAGKDGDKATETELKNRHKNLCRTVREDGAFIEVGENDNLIVQKLRANPDAVGIFGYSFLDQNSEKVRAIAIDEVSPEFDSISDGSYPVSRPLYFYVKKAHVGSIPGLKEFLAQFISEKASGEYGYLTDKGLIPLNDEKRAQIVDDVANLNPMTL